MAQHLVARGAARRREEIRNPLCPFVEEEDVHRRQFRRLRELAQLGGRLPAVVAIRHEQTHDLLPLVDGIPVRREARGRGGRGGSLRLRLRG